MMKLKKVLSLVLVVAMIASMLIVGAAAAETVETTNYPEATEVMIGIGVIEGDENGYRYQDGVTREEAAKIIAYILLGADTADALKTSVAPFADVAADRWSAGYIAYLKSVGVISGVTDTLFDPTAPVTGVAFAKMMLTAIGYGKADEFEGAAWDINTITLANQLGIYDGTKNADVAAAATREECMLYGFNALTKVPTVSYNKTLEAYYTGTSALSPVTGDVVPTVTTATAPYAYTLAWKNFDLKQVTTGTTDDFGRPAASWTSEGLIVASAVANVDPDAVLYSYVYSYNIYDVYGKDIIKNLNDQIKADGTTTAITVYQDGMTIPYVWEEMKAGERTNLLSYGGAVVELYLEQNTTTGNYSLDIVIYYEHLGEVTRVVSTPSLTTLTIADVAGGTYTVTSDQLDVSAFAKKDLVKFTAGSANGTAAVASLDAVTPVVATYGNWNPSYYAYVMDGAFYWASTFSDTSAIDTFGNSYELYLDSFGNILYAELYEEGESANQYVYVVGVDTREYDPDNLLDGKDAAVAVSVIYPNGGKEVLYYNVKSDKLTDTNVAERATPVADTAYYITKDGVDYVIGTDALYAVDAEGKYNSSENVLSTAIPVDSWMRYTLNDSNAVTLKALNPSYASVETVTTETNRAAIATGYTANSATVLTLVDDAGNAVSYTGIKNFVDCTNETALVTYGLNSKVAKTITIIVDSISTSMNLAYCAGAWAVTDEGTTYMFYVDGVMQYITTDSTCTSGNIYDIQIDDGVYTASLVADYADSEATGEKGAVNEALWDKKAGAADKTNYGWYDGVTATYTYFEHATIDAIDDGFFTTVATEGGKAAITAVADAEKVLNNVTSECPGSVESIIAEQGKITAANAAILALDKESDDYDTKLKAEQDKITAANGVIANLEAAITKAMGISYLGAKANYDAAVAAQTAIESDVLGGIIVDAHTYYFDANTVVYDITGGGATEISEGDVFVAFVDETASAVYANVAYVSHIWIVG